MCQVCFLLGQQSLGTKNSLFLEWKLLFVGIKILNLITFDSSRWLCFDRLTRHMLLLSTAWLDRYGEMTNSDQRWSWSACGDKGRKAIRQISQHPSQCVWISNQTELWECKLFVIVHEIIKIFMSQYFAYITPMTDIFDLMITIKNGSIDHQNCCGTIILKTS